MTGQYSAKTELCPIAPLEDCFLLATLTVSCDRCYLFVFPKYNLEASRMALEVMGFCISRVMSLNKYA